MTAAPPDDGAPLYRRIVRDLHGAILRREYTPDRPFISQREVCERFGVSTATAIRALNEMVNQGILVRQRGRGTFVAERRAKPAGGESGMATIACIMFGLRSGHVSQMLAGVEAGCKELGYRLLLSNSEASSDEELTALRRAADDRVAGIVLFPVEGSRNALAIEEIRTSGIPVVMVDRYLADIATGVVTADNFAVGYQTTEKLLELGHQRIATLWDEIDCTSVRDRLTGHRQALRARKVAEDAELTVLRSYLKLPHSARRQRLSALLSVAEPPTALLCVHGYVLAAVLDDLAAIDRDRPEQVALASMDDIAPFDIAPFIAAAAVLPSKEMGRVAVGQLDECITAGEPTLARHIVLPVDLRERVRERRTAPQKPAPQKPAPEKPGPRKHASEKPGREKQRRPLAKRATVH